MLGYGVAVGTAVATVAEDDLVIGELLGDDFDAGGHGAVFVDGDHGVVDDAERFDDAEAIGFVDDDFALLEHLLGVVVHDDEQFVTGGGASLDVVKVADMDGPEVAADDYEGWLRHGSAPMPGGAGSVAEGWGEAVSGKGRPGDLAPGRLAPRTLRTSRHFRRELQQPARRSSCPSLARRHRRVRRRAQPR